MLKSFLQKKTGNTVSTYSSNAFDVMQIKIHYFMVSFVNTIINENNKLNPDAIQNNVLTRSPFLSNYRTYTMCIGLYD